MPSDNRKIPEVNIDFQVDTLQQNNDTWAAAYFSSNRNTVTSNYKPGDEEGNKYNQSDAVLIHEQKHRENAKRGLYAYPLSPEQAYKVNMHDEISATISELIYMREKYLQTGDISVLNEKGSFFDFYREAIEKGEINPKSPYKEDFEKEMRLIANGTRDKWEQLYAKQYNDNSMYDAQYTSDRSGKYARYHDENYQRAKDIAYTIGGVNFSQYMDRDAEIPEIGKFDLKILNAKEGKANQELAAELGLPAFDGSMSLEQYQKLLHHKIGMQHFLSDVPFGPKEYMDMICLNKVAYDTEANGNTKKYLQEYLNDTKNNYKSSMSAVDKNAVETLVNSVAKDYARQGKKLPEANDEAYNRAVDKIYTRHFEVQGDVNYNGNINLRSVLTDENDLKVHLPQYAQSVEKMDWWQRGLNKWADFVNLPDNHRNNMNNQMQDAGALKKYGVGTLLYIGAPIVSVIEKGKQYFTDEKPENVTNQQINKINKNAPKYRQWKNEDGSRVSEVQYRTLPDLTKEVIQKPTKSYAEEKVKTANENSALGMNRNMAKLKMGRIIDYMNKVNGEKYAVDTQKSVDALYEKYGAQAYKLLLTAVNEPTNYAKIAGDASIKTSREALQHLCSLENDEQQKMTQYAQSKEGVEISVPENNAKPAEEQKPNQPVNRIAKMRSMLMEGHQDASVAVRDNTNVASAWLEQKRFEKAVEHKPVKPRALTAEALRDQLRQLQETY